MTTIASCRRCGIQRKVKPERGYRDWCRDCIEVEQILSEEHGTNAGFERHRRRKEDPCDECREGRNAYKRSRWRPRKETAVA